MYRIDPNVIGRNVRKITFEERHPIIFLMLVAPIGVVVWWTITAAILCL